MRITVIGAAGRTGAHVVTECRRRGHDVTALARRPGSVPGDTAGITAVTGDARDPATAREAVMSADAVICTVPGGGRREPLLAQSVVASLIPAMRSAGVTRLVVTSAYPIVGERPRFAMWLLRGAFRTAYADGAQMEELVRGSGLDWVVVRLNRLTDGAATGALRTTTGQLAAPTRVTRADAANLLVDLAGASTPSCVAVNVSGP